MAATTIQSAALAIAEEMHKAAKAEYEQAVRNYEAAIEKSNGDAIDTVIVHVHFLRIRNLRRNANELREFVTALESNYEATVLSCEKTVG